MKILLIMDPGIPVPPLLYGGIERIVFQLAEEYTSLGNEVTLLAGPESSISGKVVSFGSNKLIKSKLEMLTESFFVWKYLLLHHKQFDLIHSFGRLIYLLPILNKRTKKIMSYQRDITIKSIQSVHKLPHKNLYFTGCSNYISQKKGLTGKWYTVYNFIDTQKLTFVNKVPQDAPFVFLGRLDSIKGCHNCIALSKKTNRKLIIAGNISDLPHEKAYFEDEIKPQIDGDLIQYIGPVNDVQKNELLGKAYAFLMLIEWNEPFGIVMAEALACGTPVLGFAKGAVKEVVKDGVNGIIINSLESYTEQIESRLNKIKRLDCYLSASTQFNIKHIAQEYLSI